MSSAVGSVTGASAVAELAGVVVAPAPRRSRLLPGVPRPGARRRHDLPGGARGAGDRTAAGSTRPTSRAQARAGGASAPGSPSSTATCRGEIRTIRLNGLDFGVVGVLGNGRRSIPGSTTRCSSRSRPRRERLRHRGRAEQALRPQPGRHHAADSDDDPDGDLPRRHRRGRRRGAERRARRPARRPTRRCSRPRCSPACSRSPSAASASRT